MLVRFPIKGHRPRGIRKAIALKCIYPTIRLRYLLHETDIRCTSNLGLRRLPSNFAIALKSPALRDLPSLGIRHAIACFLALGCALGLFSRSAFAEPPQRGASMPALSVCAANPVLSFSMPRLVFGKLELYSSGISISCGNFPRVVSVTDLYANPSRSQASPEDSNGVPKTATSEHHFWDRQNALLFTAVGASRTLDYFSTLNFRRRGRNEALLTDEIVDDHPAFASIEAGATALSIGVSYLFHRTHHHRLERWTSIVHASLATSGAVRNYCLKTAHP